MKRMLSFFFVFCMVLSMACCASADAGVPEVFLTDIAPNGYNVADSIMIRQGLELGINASEARGRSVMLDRHNALIAAGWELESVRVVSVDDISDSVLMQNMGTQSGVVIEGTRVVESSYKQPRVSKSKYNSALLNGISKYTDVVTTAIGAMLPRFKWVPKAVVFLTKSIADASASKKTTFEVIGTLRFYDVEVKIEGWDSYFLCASSQKYQATTSMSVNGWLEDKTPFSGSGSGAVSCQSSHYGNKTWMTNKAIEYARKNNGTHYSEDYPDPPDCTMKCHYSVAN